MSAHRKLAYIYLLIVSLIWGAAGPIIKSALHIFPPFIFLTYRFAISGVIALIYLSRQTSLHIPKKPSKQLRLYLYGFMVSTVVLGLFFVGFDHTSAIAGSFISSFNPIVTAIFGALFLHEHITKRERRGTIIAFIGMVFVIFEPIITGNGSLASSLKGNVIIFLALLVDACALVMAKHNLRDHIPAFTITNISFLIGLFTMIPVMLMVHSMQDIFRAFTEATLAAHLAVWYMALISGTLAYFLWLKAQKSIEISEAAVFGYLKPVWAVPLAMVWLGESVTYPHIIGMIIIAFGVYHAEMKKKKKRKKKKR